jgi:hypothetical protein
MTKGPENFSASGKRKKIWTFFQAIRWTVFIIFLALMSFLAICVIVGVAGNINRRYPEILLTGQALPGQALDKQQMAECFEELQDLRRQEVEQVQAAFSEKINRDEFLNVFLLWGKKWSSRLEILGLKCKITGHVFPGQAIQANLAQIYRRLEDLHKGHQGLIRRYFANNSRLIREIGELFDRAQQSINPGAQPAQP